MARTPQADHIDPADFARLCLEDELFGPDRNLSKAEIRERVADLRGAERAEAEELLGRPRTKRNRRFRARLDHLADLRDAAVHAATQQVSAFHDPIRQGLGVRDLPSWRLLVDQEAVMRRELSELEAIRARASRRRRAEQVRWYNRTIAELQPVWQFVKAAEGFLPEEFPAVGTLPWAPDWVLRLAADRLPGTRYGDGGPRISGVFAGGMIPTLRFGQPDLGVPKIEVDWSDSRDETRQHFTAALEHSFYRRYTPAPDAPRDAVPSTDDLRHDRRFRRWLKQDETWARTTAALERFLDESHPPGNRPYTRDPLRQVRRNVHVWAAVKIVGIAGWELASAYRDRFEGDPDFRAYSGGKRARFPTTAKGVRDAVGRAQRLLQQREI